MTIDTEQYTHFVEQGQDTVRKTFETWTNAVKTAVAQVPAFAAQFDAEAAVDRYFDLTEKVLETQRDVTKRLVAAGTAFAATVKA
jgi:hypothetical protein